MIPTLNCLVQLLFFGLSIPHLNLVHFLLQLQSKAYSFSWQLSSFRFKIVSSSVELTPRRNQNVLDTKRSHSYMQKLYLLWWPRRKKGLSYSKQQNRPKHPYIFHKAHICTLRLQRKLHNNSLKETIMWHHNLVNVTHKALKHPSITFIMNKHTNKPLKQRSSSPVMQAFQQKTRGLMALPIIRTLDAPSND